MKAPSDATSSRWRYDPRSPTPSRHRAETAGGLRSFEAMRVTRALDAVWYEGGVHPVAGRPAQDAPTAAMEPHPLPLERVSYFPKQSHKAHEPEKPLSPEKANDSKKYDPIDYSGYSVCVSHLAPDDPAPPPSSQAQPCTPNDTPTCSVQYRHRTCDTPAPKTPHR